MSTLHRSHIRVIQDANSDGHRYTESGTLEGYLDKPYGLDVLMNETYGISGSVRTASSPFLIPILATDTN